MPVKVEGGPIENVTVPDVLDEFLGSLGIGFPQEGVMRKETLQLVNATGPARIAGQRSAGSSTSTVLCAIERRW